MNQTESYPNSPPKETASQWTIRLLSPDFTGIQEAALKMAIREEGLKAAVDKNFARRFPDQTPNPCDLYITPNKLSLVRAVKDRLGDTIAQEFSTSLQKINAPGGASRSKDGGFACIFIDPQRILEEVSDSSQFYQLFMRIVAAELGHFICFRNDRAYQDANNLRNIGDVLSIPFDFAFSFTGQEVVNFGLDQTEKALNRIQNKFGNKLTRRQLCGSVIYAAAYCAGVNTLLPNLSLGKLINYQITDAAEHEAFPVGDLSECVSLIQEGV